MPRPGQVEEAEEILNDLLERRPMGPWKAWQIVCLAGALGKNDIAFKYLERKPKHPFLTTLAVMPEYKYLRDDPRYDDVIKQFDLPD